MLCAGVIQNSCIYFHGYPSEDTSWNAILLDDCHLLQTVSIPFGYPPEKYEPIHDTHQSNEERNHNVRLECISVISLYRTIEQLT